MNRIMRCAVIMGLCLCIVTEVWADGRWESFYSKADLDRTVRLTVPDIQAIFEEDLPRMLTDQERQELAGVKIVFPRNDASHPMNFYADWSVGTVAFPVASLKFLNDMLVSYAWLSAHGYDLQPVSDYLAMIKHKWPGLLQGQPYRPKEVLGIPDSALDEPVVSSRFQQLVGSAVVFIMGHEIGHIYHRHPGYGNVSAEQARRHEEEADDFGLKILKRFNGDAVGVAFFFTIMTHLEPFPMDPGYAQSQAQRTHPLSPERVRKVAAWIEANAVDNSLIMADARKAKQAQATALLIAGELVTAAKILNHPSLQNSLLKKGMTTDPKDLRPRRQKAAK